MKPARGPTLWRLHPAMRERRTTLLVAGFLLLLISGIVLYQRLMLRPEPGPRTPPGEEEAKGTLVHADTTRTTALTPDAGPPEPVRETAAAAVTLPGLVHPLGGRRNVLRAFGTLDRTYGDYRLYIGTAYEAALGEPVRTAAGGTVLEAERSPLHAGTVAIDHGGGLITRYHGLGKLRVETGARVEPGTVVGEIGAPGPAYAEMPAHLFVQIIENGAPVDPEAIWPS